MHDYLRLGAWTKSASHSGGQTHGSGSSARTGRHRRACADLTQLIVSGQETSTWDTDRFEATESLCLENALTRAWSFATIASVTASESGRRRFQEDIVMAADLLLAPVATEELVPTCHN